MLEAHNCLIALLNCAGSNRWVDYLYAGIVIDAVQRAAEATGIDAQHAGAVGEEPEVMAAMVQAVLRLAGLE